MKKMNTLLACVLCGVMMQILAVNLPPIKSWQLSQLSIGEKGQLTAGSLPYGALNPTELEIIQSCSSAPPSSVYYEKVTEQELEQRRGCVRVKQMAIEAAKKEYLPQRVRGYNQVVRDILKNAW